jgi:AraC-like DNA-binding protein
MSATTSASSDGMIKDAHHETNARQLLTSYTQVVERLSVAEPELRHLMVGHLYHLVALVRGATRDGSETRNGRSGQAARLEAIKTEILTGLDRRELSLAGLAARHGVTPRYVQRLFESEGLTFSQFVRDHRLERAYRMLGDRRFAQRTISIIAYDAGFGDLSHFNRAFRRRFGKCSSEARAAALSNGESPPPKSLDTRDAEAAMRSTPIGASALKYQQISILPRKCGQSSRCPRQAGLFVSQRGAEEKAAYRAETDSGRAP